MPDASNKAHPTGITKLADGRWRAFVRIHRGTGGLKSKVFPAATGMIKMRRWREAQRHAPTSAAQPQPTAGTLRADVQDYLGQVQTMATIRFRRDDLLLWIDVFGPERVTDSIESREVRTQLEQWRVGGYAANTVNHRRTALSHLFTVKHGKGGHNPVTAVPKYRDESLDAPPRNLSAIAIALILDAMPKSRTRTRLELMALTGWPPAQMMKLRPDEDIQWGVAVRLRPRRKGKGAAGVWLPLLPQAWTALRIFVATKCAGPFSTSSARASMRLAAAKVRAEIMLPLSIWRELADVTPYQLRHSFATLIAGITKDDRAVQTLLQQSDLRTTHRYTNATADPRALAALDLVTRRLHSEGEKP